MVAADAEISACEIAALYAPMAPSLLSSRARSLDTDPARS
jgi:hypothetical protein